MNAGQNTNQHLRQRLAAAQSRLYNKLANAKAEIQSSNISEYNKRYIESYFNDLEGVLRLYGKLLYLSLRDNLVAPEKFTFVDYGGGSGFMSMLALEAGIGTVIYNDIYDVGCVDAGYLSKILGLPLTHIVNGDVDDLIAYVHHHSLVVNAITSFDVVEHIYDVEAHFRRLADLSDKPFRIVYASSANIENTRYVASVRAKQIAAESTNRQDVVGSKKRDTLRAHLEIRQEIIRTYAPELTSEQVAELARSTRGLMCQDIEKAVDEFRQRGAITYRMDHPTNTCDPYTGNWCEHLMDLTWLAKVVSEAGFSVEILSGLFYNYNSISKRLVKQPLNILIQILGRRAMFVAPYYVVYAESIAR